MLIIGLMSGTSADGIDAALVDVKGTSQRIRVDLLAHLCFPHEPVIREAILRCCDAEQGRIPELCALDALLGQRFAAVARAVAESASVDLQDVAAIASHGQTVWHQPEPLDLGGVSARGTLQIGSAAVIAAETGCTVISDFRSADMAAGGQGAPLVPFADWALFGGGREPRAVQNIGGIANATFLPRYAALEDVRAFDTGPGNMVIDAVVSTLSEGRRTYDQDGRWAAKGSVDDRFLRHLLEHPYFSQPPPKTTGREVFGLHYSSTVLKEATARIIPPADIIATVTALTAESIARAYRQWLDPDKEIRTVILGGGGAHNETLVRMLKERLSPARVRKHEEFGIPDDAKEAIAFAVLGYQTLRGRASNVPSATGATYAAILGSVTPAPSEK